MTTLADLKTGQSGRITRVGAEGPVIHRLMEMGMVPGVDVEVVRVAPFGDPLQLRVRGYLLAIRRREAEKFEITT